jgi:hypothetical protein
MGSCARGSSVDLCNKCTAANAARSVNNMAAVPEDQSADSANTVHCKGTQRSAKANMPEDQSADSRNTRKERCKKQSMGSCAEDQSADPPQHSALQGRCKKRKAKHGSCVEDQSADLLQHSALQRNAARANMAAVPEMMLGLCNTANCAKDRRKKRSANMALPEDHKC